MRAIKAFAISLAITGTIFFISSCGSSYVGKENTHPHFKNARAQKDRGDFSAARKSYEEFLLIEPKSALANKELASLCDEKLKDNYSAIYYYGRYLALGKMNPADENSVKGYIANCKRKAAEEYIANNPSFRMASAGDVNAQADLAAINKLRASERLNYQAAVEKMRSEIARLSTNGATSSRETSGGGARSRNVESSGNSGSSENVVISGSEIYVVMANDTLSKIASKKYGSASRTNLDLIRNANKGKIKAGDRINEGQKLIIPTKKK